MSNLFWLSALLRPLLLPPLNLLLMMAAGFLLCRRHPRSGSTLVGTAFVLLLLLCMPFGANLLVRPLENMATPLLTAEPGQAQAIVVLSAGKLHNAPEYGGADIPDYTTLARLRYAARLQHQSGLPILVSGGNAPFVKREDTLAQAMASALREDFRTPVQWIESRSKTTEENATFSADILRAEQIDHILLVTDAMHMARASMAFTQAGLHVTQAPTMFFSLRNITPQSFIPSAEGLRRADYATYEWIGLLWYRCWLNGPSNTSTHTHNDAP